MQSATVLLVFGVLSSANFQLCLCCVCDCSVPVMVLSPQCKLYMLLDSRGSCQKVLLVKNTMHDMGSGLLTYSFYKFLIDISQQT